MQRLGDISLQSYTQQCLDDGELKMKRKHRSDLNVRVTRVNTAVCLIESRLVFAETLRSWWTIYVLILRVDWTASSFNWGFTHSPTQMTSVPTCETKKEKSPLSATLYYYCFFRNSQSMYWDSVRNTRVQQLCLLSDVKVQQIVK